MTVLCQRHSGEGTAITNAAAQSATQRAHTAPQSIAARETRAAVHVLVVDDDEVIRRLIAANLALEGFEVATAVDGQDCLAKVATITPDVITLDVTGQHPDGWETVLCLRKCPDTSHIKVVLIMARVPEGDWIRHRHVGADAYLTKPFDPGEMIRVVRELAR